MSRCANHQRMKTFLATIAAGAALLLASSCNKDSSKPEVTVPDVVLSAFKTEFPKAKDVEWSAEDANFEVDFEDGKTGRAVLYAADARVLERTEEIALSGLPASIPTYIAAHYSGYSLEEAEKSQTAEGAVSYEVEIEKGESSKEVEFDGSGNYVGEDDADDDEEDDD